MKVKTAVLNGVASIELAHVQKKNAFDYEMFTQIVDALQAAHDDAQVRAVLIYGQRDFFSLGTTVEDFSNGDFAQEDSPWRLFMKTVMAFEKPLIAAVNGPAIGIGTTMLLHCDFVYVADTAQFAVPFVSLGLVPDFASTYLLPLAAGKNKASEKLLLAQPFNAQEAVEMGIANAVLPEAEVLNYARSVAERFNKLPPAAVRETKKLLQAGVQHHANMVIQAEAQALTQRIKGAEVKEVLNAFLEKRWPDFSQF